MIEAPYHNMGTFLKADRTVSNRTRAGIVGLPWDGSTSFRTGQRMAPAQIRACSAMLTDGDHPKFRTNPTPSLVDFGDLHLGNDYGRAMADIADFYAEAKLPLLGLGGDHSVSLGALTGLKQRYLKEDIFVIIFDAHTDTWERAFGDPRGHGTWVRNLVDDGIVKARNIKQVGVRSPVDLATARWSSDNGLFPISPDQVEENTQWAADALRSISRLGHPLYISIDIDVLDPAFAPGTGTPEIGGISSRSLLRMLERIDVSNLIGADVVEVLPAYDGPSGITSLAAATALWTLLCNLTSPLNSR